VNTTATRAARIPSLSRSIVHAIDDFDLGSFRKIAANFGQQRFGFVVTPNVDHLIRFHEDWNFRASYAAADYVLLDSRFAARLAAIVTGQKLPVCTGSDLTRVLLTEVAQASDRIVVVGGRPDDVARLAREHGLTILHHDPPMGFIRDPRAVEECLQFIEAASPFRFCFLAIGSPQQEAIAARLRQRGIVRGLALCVGASLDFLTGVERRAPLWVQRLGCEWLFRLLQNPRRLARRYLVRGPRIFFYLWRDRLVLRRAA